VNQLGAAPVQGGDELARGIGEQLGDLRQDLEQARVQIERADPGDPPALGQAVAAAGDIVGSMGNSAQAVAEVSRDPRLATQNGEGSSEIGTGLAGHSHVFPDTQVAEVAGVSFEDDRCHPVHDEGLGHESRATQELYPDMVGPTEIDHVSHAPTEVRIILS
jgi:hypothetical protein